MIVNPSHTSQLSRLPQAELEATSSMLEGLRKKIQELKQAVE
jgi:hypothetical protein